MEGGKEGKRKCIRKVIEEKQHDDIVEAHCYVVSTDKEILMRDAHGRLNESIATDCRMLQPRRPPSTVYKTVANCAAISCY